MSGNKPFLKLSLLACIACIISLHQNDVATRGEEARHLGVRDGAVTILLLQMEMDLSQATAEGFRENFQYVQINSSSSSSNMYEKK